MGEHASWLLLSERSERGLLRGDVVVPTFFTALSDANSGRRDGNAKAREER